MMGEVDGKGRALLRLTVRASRYAVPQQLLVWVDTAFDGELVVSRQIIDSFGLEVSATVDAILADGSQVQLESFRCFVDWFGSHRQVEVIANDGQLPLLGIGLLQGRKLTVDYRQQVLEVD